MNLLASIPLAILSVVFSPMLGYGQSPCPEVKVLLLDSDSGLPIDGAMVLDVSSGESLTTDSEGMGAFVSAVGVDGVHTFEIAALGYPWHYREFDFGATAQSSDCTAGVSHVANLYLDAGDEMLSPLIGSSGGTVQFRKVTGQLDGGQEFIQSVSVSVPPGTWSGRYRIALSLPAPEAFTTAYLPDVVSGGGVSGSTRYPFAQVRLALQDIQGQVVDLGVLPLAMQVSLSSARVDTPFVPGQAQSVQWFDSASKTWSAGGAMVTGFDASKKSVSFDCFRLGTYSISPILGAGLGDIGSCAWVSMGNSPMACGAGASPLITTVEVASSPCGVLVDNSTIEVDTTTTKNVSSSLDSGLFAKITDAVISAGFSLKGKDSSGSTFTKKIKEKKTPNPDAFVGKHGTAYLYQAGVRYKWGYFCDGDALPLMTYDDYTYTGTCWYMDSLFDCP